MKLYYKPASCFLNRSADCGSDINYKFNFDQNWQTNTVL